MHAGQNPFSAQRIHRLPYQFTDGQSVATLADLFRKRLEQGVLRQTLCGGHGSGKSTLLRELGEYWLARGARGRRWSENSSWLLQIELIEALGQPVLLVDSGESWSWSRWQWLQWRYRRWGILTTSHRPNWLPILHECRTSADQFVGLCQRLLEDQPPSVQSAWSPATLRSIFDRNGGDVRASFFQLYDLANSESR